MLKPLRTQRGVTLVELMIAFALIAILTVLAVPAFQHWVQNSQIRNAAEGILNGMQLARAEAVRRNMSVEFIMSGASGWTITTVINPETVQTRSALEGSANAAVTITPGGADRITFNGMGWVTTNNDGSAAITRIDVTSATVSSTEIRPLRVVLTGGGSMKMCDPKVGAGDTRVCP